MGEKIGVSHTAPAFHRIRISKQVTAGYRLLHVDVLYQSIVEIRNVKIFRKRQGVRKRAELDPLKDLYPAGILLPQKPDVIVIAVKHTVVYPAPPSVLPERVPFRNVGYDAVHVVVYAEKLNSPGNCGFDYLLGAVSAAVGIIRV